MKERPILFSAPMVRALMAGTKTQTRRVVKGEPLRWLDETSFTPEFVALPENALCPYGQPGDRLWVREAWAAPHAFDHLPPRLIPADARYHYAATETIGGLLGRPSIHMPRWASRISLEITGVRVERLQMIGREDCLAEGLRGLDSSFEPKAEFCSLWESINGSGSWEANPWVWCVEFRRVHP